MTVATSFPVDYILHCVCHILGHTTVKNIIPYVCYFMKLFLWP